jgi:hypothetical protein
VNDVMLVVEIGEGGVPGPYGPGIPIGTRHAD